MSETPSTPESDLPRHLPESPLIPSFDELPDQPKRPSFREQRRIKKHLKNTEKENIREKARRERERINIFEETLSDRTLESEKRKLQDQLIQTPDDVNTKGHLAKTLYYSGDSQKAQEFADEVLDTLPDQPEANIVKGLLTVGRARTVDHATKIKLYDEAQSLFKRVIDIDPDNTEAHLFLIQPYNDIITKRREIDAKFRERTERPEYVELFNLLNLVARFKEHYGLDKIPPLDKKRWRRKPSHVSRSSVNVSAHPSSFAIKEPLQEHETPPADKPGFFPLHEPGWQPYPPNHNKDTTE